MGDTLIFKIFRFVECLVLSARHYGINLTIIVTLFPFHTRVKGISIGLIWIEFILHDVLVQEIFIQINNFFGASIHRFWHLWHLRQRYSIWVYIYSSMGLLFKILDLKCLSA